MPIDGQSQADILKLMGELPPETMKNVEALGKILQQDLKEGKLTQARIQEELKAGTFERSLRDLNPEAGPLLDDIAQQMKNHPNADNLPNLLNGMAGGGR
jgi:predicted  nucleic acid-binding Zn-ribbon protein